jgi:hypothetical protein
VKIEIEMSLKIVESVVSLIGMCVSGVSSVAYLFALGVDSSNACKNYKIRGGGGLISVNDKGNLTLDKNNRICVSSKTGLSGLRGTGVPVGRVCKSSGLDKTTCGSIANACDFNTFTCGFKGFTYGFTTFTYGFNSFTYGLKSFTYGFINKTYGFEGFTYVFKAFTYGFKLFTYVFRVFTYGFDTFTYGFMTKPEAFLTNIHKSGLNARAKLTNVCKNTLFMQDIRIIPEISAYLYKYIKFYSLYTH